MSADYLVVTEGDLESVCREVRILIAEGWKPQGGIAHDTTTWEDRNGYLESATTYHQAMVRATP